MEKQHKRIINDVITKQARNSSTEAKNVRQEYADFFLSPQGLVPWQKDY